MKKVKCIDALNCDLVEGEVYGVIKEKESFYSVINTEGQEHSYFKDRFEEVEEVKKPIGYKAPKDLFGGTLKNSFYGSKR